MASKRKRGDGGFWDFVKNPLIRKRMEAAARNRDEKSPGPTNPETIPARVAELLVCEPDHDQLLALVRSGPAAIPALVGALHDPRYHEHPYGESLLDGSALKVVLQLLEPYGPPEAVAPLTPLVRHANSQVRKEAALALGNIGTEDCLEPLTAALSDGDEYVRSYALMGLRRGIEAGRASRALLDNHVMSRSNRYVDEVIEAAVEKHIAVPAVQLLNLLDDIRTDVSTYRNACTYGAAR